MLSKILSGEDTVAAARWAWPGANSSGQAEVPAAPEEPGTQETAARHIAELEQRIERQSRDARQAGFQAGETAGRSQAVAQLQPVLENLARSIAEIAALRPQLMRDAEADLVELSIGIARRILRRELSVDPAALEGLVKVALGKLPAQEIRRVLVHPELEAGVRQALVKEGRSGLPLIADGTLERGAVVVETGRGKLDASLETQLAEIGRGLADRVEVR